jgi:16S rRNA (guanine(1405)-N(7))-methyltransferase
MRYLQGSTMSDQDHTPLDRLVEAILASPKYQSVCPDFIRRMGHKELAQRRSLKEAIKATKNKLHQVAGAYGNQKARYALWLEELRRASQTGNREDFLQACRRIMGYHASTRERLPILDHFYATTLAGLPPLRSVLDVACGLNPLAIPWMPLAENAEYYAYDVYRDLVDFLNQFMALVPVQGHVQAGDVTQGCPSHQVDLALLLKALPCLEQVDKAASLRLLEGLQADHLLVSFPVHSLGERDKGMVPHYEARFRELAAGQNWSIHRWELATELAFLVTK